VDEPIPFDAVIAILRLSNKYDIHPFRQKSIQELKKVFPCTLHDYDSIYPNDTYTTLSWSHIVKSIYLARACNTLELLPFIFYILGQVSMNVLFRSHAILPRTEMEICLLGREKLQEMRETVAFSYLIDPKSSQHCLNPTICEQQRLLSLNALISERFHAGTRALMKADLETLEMIFCRPCAEEKLSIHLAAREKLWNDLPSYFGLGTWEELRSAQK
jgi:hypothetical protein